MSVSKSRLLLSGLTAVSVLGVGVAGATSLNIGAEQDAAQFSFLDVKADDNFDRNTNDGKKLVFKDKTNNYFVCMRSMNGYQIFPEMANGTAKPEGKTLPTAA